MNDPATPIIAVTPRMPRRPRLALLVNAGATLAAAIAVIGTGGPKLPPSNGD